MVRAIGIMLVALAGVAGAQGTPTPYTPGGNSTDDNSPPPPQQTAPSTAEPTVRVTMNGSGVYDRGDQARVHVRVRDDGYLIALHATTDGRVVPLYPSDPSNNGFVRGGSEFDIQGRGSDASFVVDGRGGTGTVYVAYSRQPFNLTDFERNGHWDFDAFPDSGVSGHAEAVMTDLVQHMAQEHFDYDLASYSVTRSFHRAQQQQQVTYDDEGSPYDGGYAAYPYYYGYPVAYDPWWYGPGWWGYDPYWYSPFFFGVGFGFGYGFGGCCFGGYYHHGYWGHGGYGWGGRGGYYNRASFTTVNNFNSRNYRGNVFAAGHLGVGGSATMHARTGTVNNGVFSNVGLRGGVTANRAGGSTVFNHTVSASPSATPNTGRAVFQGSQGSRVSASRVATPGGNAGMAQHGGGFQGSAGARVNGGGNFAGGGMVGGSRGGVTASRVAPHEVGPSQGDAFRGGQAMGGGARPGGFSGGRAGGFGGRPGGFSGGRAGGFSGGGFRGGGGGGHGGGGGGGHGGGGHR